MRKLILLFLILICYFNTAFCQQSLFNAPSSDITHRHKFFVQEQINFFQKSEVSNLTLNYGLGKGFEIGCNVFGTQFPSGDRYHNSVLCFNSQKEFVFTKNFKTATGIQLCHNLFAKKQGLWVFQNFVYQPKLEKLKLYFGAYYSSKYYDGTYASPGLMGGFDYEISKKWHTMGDALWSKNTQSQTVMGFVYFATPHFPISLGAALPFNTLTSPAIVLELTFVP